VLTLYKYIKMHGHLNVRFLLNSAPDEREWSTLRSGRFTTVTEPRHPFEHVCMCPPESVWAVSPLPRFELDHPVRSLVAIPGSTKTSTFTQVANVLRH
jgi:hypothetical protein